MNISFIVAVSLNHVIGVDNKLPWHLPADLQYFKKLTTGYPIVMGRKTYASIGRPLPFRENIVITHSFDFTAPGVLVMHSLPEVLSHCVGKREVFVIGGETIFNQLEPYANRIYLTLVHTEIEHGDAFFTLHERRTWHLSRSEFHERDEKNPFDYTFQIYERA